MDKKEAKGIENIEAIDMENLQNLLIRKKLRPEVIAKNTGIPIGIINGLIDETQNIWDISLSSVLLLCQYIGVSIIDLIDYCVVPERDWIITVDQSVFFLSFRIGGQEYKLTLGAANETNTKYIEPIAHVDYEAFLRGIIENESSAVEMELSEKGRYEKFISEVLHKASIHLYPESYEMNDWGTVKQHFDIKLLGIPLVTGLPLSGTAEIDIPWQLIDDAGEEEEIYDN